MPPKAAATEANGTKIVPADCVSVLLMAIGNTTITKQQLNMMSALDGTRTASSFEHQFRSIIAKAKDLKARVDNGEEFTPVAPAKKHGETTTPKTTPKANKRKNVCSEDNIQSTSFKKKATPRTPRAAKKAETPKSATPLSNGFDEDFPEDSADFIKGESKWEEEQDFA